jgi:hypothetical protein
LLAQWKTELQLSEDIYSTAKKLGKDATIDEREAAVQRNAPKVPTKKSSVTSAENCRVPKFETPEFEET